MIGFSDKKASNKIVTEQINIFTNWSHPVASSTIYQEDNKKRQTKKHILKEEFVKMHNSKCSSTVILHTSTYWIPFVQLKMLGQNLTSGDRRLMMVIHLHNNKHTPCCARCTY